MKDLARTWLSLHCGLAPGVSAGAVYLGAPERGPFASVARWPDDAPEPASLTAAAQDALLDRCVVIRAPRRRDGEDGPQRDAIALPLVIDDALWGSVAVEVPHRPKEQQEEVVAQLRVAAGWLAWAIERVGRMGRVDQPGSGNAGGGQVSLVLDLLARGLEARGFRATATVLATELAARLDLDRVSVGFREGTGVRLAGLSHSAEFSSKAGVVRLVEAAMEEALDQHGRVGFPAAPGDEPRVRHAHEALAAGLAGAAVCTLPLSDGDRLVGALTLERSGDEPLGGAGVELCEHLASLVGPVLEARRRAERPLRERLRERAVEFGEDWMGPGHTGAKLAAAGVAALLLGLAILPMSHRVSASATIEGTTRRVVAAPIDGFLVAEHVRPGDVVEAGQRLAALDDRDLALQRLEWQASHDEASTQHREALAHGDWAQVSILAAQRAQARARLELVDAQLARTKLVAPFDGIVVKGDLAQALGSPVERGQVIFEITPLDSYRIILEVDERDIGHVALGQEGRLALSSIPGESFPARVERITPIATAEDGRNHFRVEARLENPPDALRPGMEGVAKISVGRRSALWLLGHDLFDRLRLALWTWAP